MWNQGGYGSNSTGGSMGMGTGDTNAGYMASPGGGYGSQAGQAGGGAGRGRSRAQSIMPCSISQVLRSQQEDDKFVFDGIELHQITLVALVRSMKETPTRLDYELDDMSGPTLDVRQFVDNDDDAAPGGAPGGQSGARAARENTYVRVHGHIRAFGGKRSVVAFRVTPVTDMNELTMHLLEVMHSHIALTKGAGELGAGPNAAVTAVNQGYIAGGGSAAYGMHQASDVTHGMTPVQAKVHNIIRACRDEQGLGVQVIAQRMGGTSRMELQQAIEFLSNEGHIYSTIDDDHFKSTDAME